MQHLTAFITVTLGAFVACGVAACSASSEDPGGGPSGSGGSPFGGAGGAAGGAGQGAGNVVGGGGVSSGSGGFLNISGSASSGGSGAGGAENCGVQSKPEEIIEYKPVGIFIMQDRSSSMVTGQPNASPEGWNQASQATAAFVNDPSSSGISVGLGFFPPLTGIADCAAGANCGGPAVAMATLPQNAAPFTSAMQGARPPDRGLPLFTPIECGLRGMVAQCKAFTAASQIPCAAVLVTDGTPTECSQDNNVLSGIVAQSLTEGVKTFVIGMLGSNIANLDILAQAGGTNKAIDVSGGSQAFIQALQSIRQAVSVGTKLQCEWTIPPPPSGQVFDRNKVNLKFTPKGGAPMDFGFVGSEADCANANNAWRFDDEANPKKILVCPSTCDMLKNSTGAEMNVEFGCARRPATIQ